jgi:hypothetical protein
MSDVSNICFYASINSSESDSEELNFITERDSYTDRDICLAGSVIRAQEYAYLMERIIQ